MLRAWQRTAQLHREVVRRAHLAGIDPHDAIAHLEARPLCGTGAGGQRHQARHVHGVGSRVVLAIADEQAHADVHTVRILRARIALREALAADRRSRRVETWLRGSG